MLCSDWRAVICNLQIKWYLLLPNKNHIYFDHRIYGMAYSLLRYTILTHALAYYILHYTYFEQKFLHYPSIIIALSERNRSKQ